jgi:peptidoglycan hydrolase-like protein with peptidoglycan-binding domain
MVEQQKVDGTLGFAGTDTIVAPSSSPTTGSAAPGASPSGPAGGAARTLTWLPGIGQTIKRGQAVYAADNRPVPLWYGSVPLWRELSTGASDGPDVKELKQNLKALGFGRYLADDDHYSWATAEAVKKWQKAQGLTATGSVAAGDVVVEPSAIRVTSLTGTLGSALQGTVLTATSTTRLVSVELAANDASIAHRGEHVTVQLPGGGSAPARVSEVGTVAKAPASAAGSAGSAGPGGNQPGAATDNATITVDITLDSPAAAGNLDGAPVTVEFTSGEHPNVLSVPVTALLATLQGSYAVDVVAADGTSRLVTVTLGYFADSNVEVSGPGLRVGAEVAVASS